jgi:quinol monooxygenase YgiN/catechol 2,3-dioxygenase-like lactoylglutathione lyase family enzyme
MITVTALQRVRPGCESEVDALMRRLTSEVQAHEPGCARFDYVRTSGDPLSRLVYEQYRDRAAFENHRGTPYLAEALPELVRCLEGPPQVTVYDDIDTGVDTAVDLRPSFFHVGIVVPDLDRAVARYSDVFGIEFTEPAVFDIPRLEDPDPHPFKMTAAFSRTERPYYELIQAAGDGIVSAAQVGRILYYGVWEPDMAARQEALRAQGVGIDALFRMDADSTPYAMITAPDLMGARIEYVDVADAGPIQEWVRTGVFPGGIGA